MSQPATIERVPTGVAGLDAVLRGGFTRGGIHVLQGLPGAGKTTLGNQICFHHAAGGGRALYVTLLAESHARMLLHLGTLRFFDRSQLLDRITYISAIGALESDGLPGLVQLLRREVTAQNAEIMILDGLVAAEDRAGSDSVFKRFIQDLQTQAGLHGCTVFLLTTARGRAVPPEYTMVDGILELGQTVHQSRAERTLAVGKLRGSDYLAGRHAFEITQDGLVVYPRLEAAFHRPSRPDPAATGRLSCGVAELDTALGGGLLATSMTGVFGPSGAGKTTLGLHFLAGSSTGEPGLLFGCFESPPRVLQQGAALGLPLEQLVADSALDLIWAPQGENLQDALAHKLLDAVERRGVKRLFIDGLAGFIESAFEDGRTSRFFSVLNNELRARGVTGLCTIETRDILASSPLMPVDGISGIMENLIGLRFVEHDAALHRVLSIVKVRGQPFDPRLRAFAIVPGRGLAFVPPVSPVTQAPLATHAPPVTQAPVGPAGAVAGLPAAGREDL